MGRDKCRIVRLRRRTGRRLGIGDAVEAVPEEPCVEPQDGGQRRDAVVHRETVTDRTSLVRYVVCVRMTQEERMSWPRAGSLLVLTFMVCAAGPNLGERQDREYSNQDHGWTIASPRDWRLDDRDKSYVKITSPGDPAGIVGIHSALFERDRINIDDFASAVMANESRRPGFKILSRQPIARSDGTSALEVVNVLGVKPAGRSRKIFVIAGHRGFVVNAETYLDAWPSFEA